MFENVFLSNFETIAIIGVERKNTFLNILKHSDSTGECRKMGVRVLLPFPLSAHAAGYTLDDYALLDVRRYGVQNADTGQV